MIKRLNQIYEIIGYPNWNTILNLKYLENSISANDIGLMPIEL